MLVVIAVAGSALCGALARLTSSGSAASGPYSFAAGASLPLPVINNAAGAVPLFIGFCAVFCALGYAGWRLAVAWRDAPDLAEWGIVAAQAAVGLALSFFSITLSSDPYAYALFARVHGVFGLNPYILSVPLRVLHDGVLAPILTFFGDPPLRDDYGPLWTLVVGIVGRIESHATLWTQVWTERLLAVAGAAACSAGLLRILRRASRATRTYGVALFAFHPLVLWESAVGGHNDLLMLGAVVWAFALVEMYPLIAGIAMGAAIGIKYVPIIVLPALIGRAFRTWGWASAAACAAIALAIPIVSFAPFWAGAATFGALRWQASELGYSPTTILLAPLLAGSHGLVASPWARAPQIVLGLLVVWLAIVACVRAARGTSLPALWRPIVTFMWSVPSMNSWYIAWLAPAIAFGGRWATYAWWLGAFAIFNYAFYMGAAGRGSGGFALAAGTTLVLLIAPAVIALRSPA